MSKKIKNLIITSSLVFGLVLFLAPQVKAATLKDAFQGQLGTVGTRSGFNTNQRNVEPIIGTLISVALSFLGVIFLILMIYGGYMWMSAAGNEEKAKKARALIQAAIIGLIVVVGAYAITVFVMARISKDLIPGSGSTAGTTATGDAYDPSKGDSATNAGGCCLIHEQVNVPEAPRVQCKDVGSVAECGTPYYDPEFLLGLSCLEVPACQTETVQGGCCVETIPPQPPLRDPTYNCYQAAGSVLCNPLQTGNPRYVEGKQCSDPECKQ